MASDAGELVVKISADVADMKAALQVLTQNVGEVGTSTIAMGSVMGDVFEKLGSMVVQFGTDSVKAFGEQEQTLLRLTNLVGTDASESFQAYADSIEKTTAFSHDQVLAMEQQLAQFGLMPDQIQKASGALIDYAAETGKSLPEAADVLGRAMAGNSRELRALGVEIFTTDDRSTKFNKTIDALSEKFGGVAEQMAGTTLGSFAQLGNAFKDLEESVGKFIGGVGGGFVGWLTSLVKNVTSSINTITSFIAEVGNIGKVFEAVFIEIGREVVEFLDMYITKLSALGPILKFLHIDIDAIKQKIEAKMDVMQKDIALTETSATTTVKAEKSKVVSISDTQRALDQYLSSLQHSIQIEQMVADNIDKIGKLETEKKILNSQNVLAQMEIDEQRMTEITNLETNKRLLTAEDSWEAQAKFSDQFSVKLDEDLSKNTSAFVDMAQHAIDQWSQATAKMILQGGKFSDIMKNIWNDLAQAIISQILRMIAEWAIFTAMTGGGGFGFGFMAEGGMVEEPSILVGMKTGSRHVVGEAGPEMVMPMSAMSGSGGNYAFSGAPDVSMGGDDNSGGGVTVNISGQFLEGSASKWQQMVRDTILPEIRRVTMSTPVGPFNRKRGAA